MIRCSRASNVASCRCPSFFLSETASTDTYTLSLHDALPIFFATGSIVGATLAPDMSLATVPLSMYVLGRSEEHTSELQSRRDLVCRLLLEKKKKRPDEVDRLRGLSPQEVSPAGVLRA